MGVMILEGSKTTVMWSENVMQMEIFFLVSLAFF